jgi:hypothetical protein
MCRKSDMVAWVKCLSRVKEGDEEENRNQAKNLYQNETKTKSVQQFDRIASKPRRNLIMKKNLLALLSILILISFVLSACKPAPAPVPQAEAPAAPAAEAPAAPAPAAKPFKIGFFVSDLSNVFHQAQFAEAKKYAAEKYGAEVFAFDGKSDSAVMTQNVDQVVAQGMDAATLHIWDADAAKPGVLEALDKGIIMTSFFSPLADTGIPTARSDEAGTSFAMGAEMATQWKAAHPDKPIVMVQLGWPNHTEVKSGRTDPFVAGVSVRRSHGDRSRLPGCQQRPGCCQADHPGPGHPAPRSQPDLLGSLQPDRWHDGCPDPGRARARWTMASR